MSKTWGEIREEALRKCGQLPPKTNADRIRSMSDDDLARWMALNSDCYYCKAKVKDGCASLATTACEDIWLDYLKSPVEVDNVCSD